MCTSMSLWCFDHKGVIDKQVKSNVLTAKKYVHAHGNSKHRNNKPSIDKAVLHESHKVISSYGGILYSDLQNLIYLMSLMTIFSFVNYEE